MLVLDLEPGVALVAAIYKHKHGVWKVLVFTGTDARGKPTQMLRTVCGSKRDDAERLAASLEVGRPGSASPAGPKVTDVLDAWIDQNLDTGAPASSRDQQSRVRSIKQDKIANTPIAQLSIPQVEQGCKTPAFATNTARSALRSVRPSARAG